MVVAVIIGAVLTLLCGLFSAVSVAVLLATLCALRHRQWGEAAGFALLYVAGMYWLGILALWGWRHIGG